jgi:Ca2+-binding RTX toxin-like protein
VFPGNYTGAVAGKRDTVTDFTPGTDKIDLTGIDSHFGSGYHAFNFIGNAAFDGHAGELHTSYDAAHNVTIVEADTTGSKAASFGIELTGNLTLSTTDFTAASLLQPLNLTATANNQTLTGGPFSNTLNDGGFAVTMIGGPGNDTYLVHNTGDTLIEKSGIAFTPPAGWTVDGTADFNKDGNTDVLVTNGMTNQFWLLNSSGAVQSTVAAPTWGNGWQLLGLIDYNHDGNLEVLQQNNMLGLQEVDYLNGTTYAMHYVHTSGLTPDPVQPLTANEGTDTVISSISYPLPGGVENLTLASGAGNINGIGNSLNNVITANEGNNILTGGGGTDTFVFGPSFGKDAITDFHIGDTIQFDLAVFPTVQAVLAALGPTDAQGNTTITANANEAVTVDNVSATILQQHSDAFHLK